MLNCTIQINGQRQEKISTAEISIFLVSAKSVKSCCKICTQRLQRTVFNSTQASKSLAKCDEARQSVARGEVLQFRDEMRRDLQVVGVEVVQQTQEDVVVHALELHFFVGLLPRESVQHQRDLFQVLASVIDNHAVREDGLAADTVLQVAVLRVVHEPLEVKGETGRARG